MSFQAMIDGVDNALKELLCAKPNEGEEYTYFYLIADLAKLFNLFGEVVDENNHLRAQELADMIYGKILEAKEKHVF